MSRQKTTAIAAPTEVHAGFLPLVDCAPLAIAHELGFDRNEGLTFCLHREVSWANIRDKIDIGALDCAHMLAPMPLAATLGLGRATRPVIAPMGLSLNGNAITVSRRLFDEMRAADAESTAHGGFAAARAVRAVVDARQSAGREPLTLGMVYPFSSHNYDLRCWLAGAGIDPDNDINLVVVPPPLLTASLEADRVDGFCVGAPWNSVAVASGNGVIIATKNELWPASPEKVLGVREDWAERNRELLGAIIRALANAAGWLDHSHNRQEAARILSAPAYTGVSAGILEQPLTGRMQLGGGQTRVVEDMVIFGRAEANIPRRTHAIWFLTQMIRWGQVRAPFALAPLAERVYRPDLFLSAVPRGAASPGSVFRQAADAMQRFCGEDFDPRCPMAYLERIGIRAALADLAAFDALNP